MRPANLPILALLGLALVATAGAAEKPATTKVYRYLESPRRSMTVFLPEGWKAEDQRATLVIFRCRIPKQREHFLESGMVVIKPGTAPVNSGKLPGMSLEDIAAAPKPRDQVADTKSAIRFIRAHADELGIDPRKIVATGTSGGGDLALQAQLNRKFEHPSDAERFPGVSHRPDALVLYAPAFDGIDIWFVKGAEMRARTEAEAPAFLPLLARFVSEPDAEYVVPKNHRAQLLQLAGEIAVERSIPADQTRRFQAILEMFNERDWQLLHPPEDALQMSASRLLRPAGEEALPPTLILLGDRDHLREPQRRFLARARELGHSPAVEIYEGGGHSFMVQPAFEAKSTAEVQSFLEGIEFLQVAAPDSR